MYAPIYTNRDEVGKGLVVFGRGTLRGAPVVTTSLTQTKTNGWLWGNYDGVQRWGQNDVSQITDEGQGYGELLQIDFPANGGPNEAFLSGGDSSGAVFILDGGVLHNLVIPGALSVSANCINNHGEIGGGYTDATGSRGFVYDRGRVTDVIHVLWDHEDVGGSADTQGRVEAQRLLEPHFPSDLS